jgi:hypothetical protein
VTGEDDIARFDSRRYKNFESGSGLYKRCASHEEVYFDPKGLVWDLEILFSFQSLKMME